MSEVRLHLFSAYLIIAMPQKAKHFKRHCKIDPDSLRHFNWI